MCSKTKSTKSSHEVGVLMYQVEVVGNGLRGREGGTLSEADVGGSSVKAAKPFGAIKLREGRELAR